MLSAATYLRTIHYLRPVQIYGRLWRKFYHPKPDLRPPPPLREPSGRWSAPFKKIPSLLALNRFRFLNEEHEISLLFDWNRPDWDKLWLYNLHYFNDLNADWASSRCEWHKALFARWIAENPPGTGNGWEPYPLSLRIVNWIKWALTGNNLPREVLESLVVQVRFLVKRLEYHLLGNHLLANAKALVIAGHFFEGKEADAWSARGARILSRELPKQILEDGGHYERSPMYHSIVLEDLLDLLNLVRCYSDRPSCRTEDVELAGYTANKKKGEGRIFSRICGTASQMLGWLNAMCFPDGQISLLNDAAFGIASPLTELRAYAEQMGIHESDEPPAEHSATKKSFLEIVSYGRVKLTHLKASGYIRVDDAPMAAILDVAKIGPEFQPGHAHADTLSFELALFGHRVIVDSGTSTYAEGEERQAQRGTKAHNTVVIDGKDSSEVWGSFRVARRAQPFGLQLKEKANGDIVVRCAHDGYRRLSGKPVHWREWHFKERSLEVIDLIEGKFTKAVGGFHFHPDTSVISGNSAAQGEIHLPNGSKMNWQIIKGHAKIIQSEYYPEFGKSHQNRCLEIELIGNAAHVVFHWL